VAGGAIGMMVPQGSRSDPKARLYAFKLRQGRLPVLTDRNWGYTGDPLLARIGTKQLALDPYRADRR
jgi:hypothetical protein